MAEPARGRDLLKAHEVTALDALLDELEPQATALLLAQLDRIEVVRRPSDTETLLYAAKSRRRDPTLALPNQQGKVCLATVRVHGSRGAADVAVHLVKGQLFRLTSRPAGVTIGRPVSAGRIVHHVDPMTPSATAPGVD